MLVIFNLIHNSQCVEDNLLVFSISVWPTALTNSIDCELQTMSETTIPLSDPQLALPLFGPRDQNIKRIRETVDVQIVLRDGQIRLTGEENNVVQGSEIMQRLKKLAERHGGVSNEDLERVISQVTGVDPPPATSIVDVIQVGKKIRPRTEGQKKYLDAIRRSDIVFAIGPAGTGKTYLAVAAAVEALKNNTIRKIVLVRPAVEAGESLGYLPGDMQAKINPYLRPLLDAIQEMVDYDQFAKLMEQDVIEVVPLAYMRGRTLNESFIILDEAQNSTISQMKMFLTRMGADSKIVVSGDTTQIDLPYNVKSGLQDALYRLRNIKGIETIHLTAADIVRHRLVQNIVDAYEKDGKSSKGPKRESAENDD